MSAVAMDGGLYDLYADLGLAQKIRSSDQEIRKAYREKALQCHPDKRRGDAAAAAAEFDRVKKAYDVLSDPSGRKAYDDLLRVQEARAERLAQQGSKRQKMVADLHAREAAGAVEKNEEEIAKKRLKEELQRIRKKAAVARQEQRTDYFGTSQAASTGDVGGTTGVVGGGGLGEEEMQRTLKVSWAREEGGGDAYPSKKLRIVFEHFGPVEDVVVRDGKKKKGSALVVMASQEAAHHATRSFCGDHSNPLLVVPMAKFADPGMSAGAATSAGGPVTPGGYPFSTTGSDTRGGAGGSNWGSGDGERRGGGGEGGGHANGKLGRAETQTNGGPPPVPTCVVGSSFRDYESATLMRMKQAAERARLEKEIREADREEEEAAAGAAGQ